MTRNTTSHRSLAVFVGLALSAVGVLPAPAAIVTFKDGSTTPILGGTYTGTQDAAIARNNLSGGTNIGGHVSFWVGQYVTDTRRTLMRFDVSALTGQYSQINSITLKLFTESLNDYNDNPPATNTLEVFEIASANQSWVEGTKNFTAATTGEATWNQRNHATNNWAGTAGASTAGTDYVNSVLASATYSPSTTLNVALGGGLSFGGGSVFLTNLINDWNDGTNPGLLLKASSEINRSLIRFYSADSASTSFRPELRIDYTEIPEPASLALLAAGAAVMLRRERR